MHVLSSSSSPTPSDNYIGTAGAVMLSDHLASNTALEELTLKGNELGDDGLTALCKALQQRPRSLKVLDVGNNSLTEVGAAALAEWLPGAEDLQELNVYMNDMGDGGAHKVGLHVARHLSWPMVYEYAIAHTSSLVNIRAVTGHLVQLAGPIKGATTLRVLDIGGNNIGPDGIAVLVHALKGHEALRSLELGYNPIGPEGVKSLVEVAKYDLQVRTVYIHYLHIRAYPIPVYPL